MYSIFRQPPSYTGLRKSFMTSKLLILKNALFDHKSWASSTQVSREKKYLLLKVAFRVLCIPLSEWNIQKDRKIYNTYTYLQYIFCFDFFSFFFPGGLYLMVAQKILPFEIIYVVFP